MSNNKKLKDLTIRDNFMFAVVMMEQDNCKYFLDFVKEDIAEKAQECEDAFVRQLQNSMQRIKQNREMERQYMLLEDLLREERKAAERKGELKTAQEFILDILYVLGNISEEIRNRIMSETNIDTLKHMHKAAVQCNTVKEFEEIISNL